MTIAPRWRKVHRDILERRGRSLLAVLAMAAGVFQITAMLYKYALLQPELTGMYGRTHPASATLMLDRVSDALVDSVLRVPGVATAEVRPVVLARVRVGEDEWVPAMLYVVRDFDHLRVDTFEPNDGAWPPGEGDVLLERTALQVARVSRGESLTVRTAGGDDRSLRVAGTVYAAGLPPAWMEHMVPGFVSWRSVVRGEGESAQLRIIVADHPLDEGYIREVADSVRSRLEHLGLTVSRVSVPAPGRHPHAAQMEAFLYLLLAFGILSFALSAVLVASMIHGLMTEQVRQVGMMKAIGATSRQIAGIYLGQVSLLAVASLILGIPLGLVVGGAYARFAAGILNADISHAPFPIWVVLAVIAVGILVPLLVALMPVQRASRITVHHALSGDPDPRPFGTRRLDRALAAVAWLPRPLALSLRTTFQRRGRLALTVAVLAIGGAVFMSALNVSGAWIRAVDRDFAGRRYDLALGLSRPYPIDTLATLLAGVPGVEHAEYWPGGSPYLIGSSGVPGGTVALVGPDPGSRLMGLPLVRGRWLGVEDRDAAVINRAVVNAHPGLDVGDTVRVRLNGRDAAFPIVGMVKELTPMPVIYASPGAVFDLIGQSHDLARSIRVVTSGYDAASQLEVARGLERAFEARGIEIRGMQRTLDAKQGILDHLVIILAILTMASVIVVFVGALGLTSTLTLNVIQRTREIGILGAIGATPGTIARHIWFEGVLIGVLSWGLALLLAVPVSAALETTCGRIFFNTALDLYLSPGGAALWLGLVVVLASLGSFYPARRAARLTVREALSHA